MEELIMEKSIVEKKKDWGRWRYGTKADILYLSFSP